MGEKLVFFRFGRRVHAFLIEMKRVGSSWFVVNAALPEAEGGNKSEILNSKSETNPNDQKVNDQNKAPKWFDALRLLTTGGSTGGFWILNRNPHEA